ncbi:MAG TPA: hypothetical protein VKT82_06305 [Ktedonobacterales bacterium]|nr:hypothetical protein [Ktedonobacterales bacterium]
MSSALPHIYAAWLAHVIPGPIPEETQATCHQCAMCPSVMSPSGSPYTPNFFHPQTKCCTYLPRLPNFLVGQILADQSPEMEMGRASVVQRITRGVAVSPLGLGQDAVYSLLYRQGREAAFGRSRALRCPHYIEEGGLCGIWRYREATCVTWFCKHVRGAVGKRFWETLKRLLFVVEESLACWCVQHLEVGSQALQHLFLPPQRLPGSAPLEAAELDGIVDPQRYQAIWGQWAGRECDFYLASVSLVGALTWDAVCALCGPELPVLIRLTQEAYQALLSTTIPPVLWVRPLKMITREPGWSRAIAYSGNDPLRLPDALLGALAFFDGRPLEEVRQRLATEAQVALTDALIRKLADFEVLAPSGAEE